MQTVKLTQHCAAYRFIKSIGFARHNVSIGTVILHGAWHVGFLYVWLFQQPFYGASTA
ncbi:hypothetical protein EMIT0P228_40064 [Pseudomonas brassicacearum]